MRETRVTSWQASSFSLQGPGCTLWTSPLNHVTFWLVFCYKGHTSSDTLTSSRISHLPPMWQTHLRKFFIIGDLLSWSKSQKFQCCQVPLWKALRRLRKLWLWDKYKLCAQPWISSVCLIKKSGVQTWASPQGQWNGPTWKLPSHPAHYCLPEANTSS